MKNQHSFFKQAIALLCMLCGVGFESSAQVDSVKMGTENIFELSVEEVLELSQQKRKQGSEITLLSNSGENIFDVPLGASLVTREEIQHAGCLSVVEALRLLPGVVVRETSAGNYTVSVRGADTMPPASDFTGSDQNYILVMINNRPIYNYFSGGISWESIPVAVHDIERIELIRGAATALYGLNAATGVINFITRRPETDGTYTTANLQYGGFNTLLANTAFGYKFNNSFSIITSANFTQRNRHTDQFYNLSSRRYESKEEVVDFPSYQTGETPGNTGFYRAYPDPLLASRKLGVNSFIHFQPSNKVAFDLDLGMESTQSLRPLAENTFTPHSTLRSDSRYINLHGTIVNGQAQVSYWGGEQEPGLETLGAHYNFGIWDASFNYLFKIRNLSIQPAVGVNSATYDDTAFFPSETQNTGILNARKTTNLTSGALRLDYQAGGLRVVGAGRVNQMNAPGEVYFTWQGILNYKIADKHLLRASYSTAHQGAVLTALYANASSTRLPIIAPGNYSSVTWLGNEDLKLMEVTTMEAGYRLQPRKGFLIEIEGFRSSTQNYHAPVAEINGTEVVATQTNLDLEMVQQGITFSMDYTTEEKTFLKAFLTVQKNQIYHFSPYFITPNSDATGTRNITVQDDINHYRGTPSWYGGFYVYHRISRKFSIQTNSYFFGRQELRHRSTIFAGNTEEKTHIKAKVLLNASLAYKPVQQLTFFVNGRNLFFQKNMEYYFTDEIGTTLLGGINFEF